MHGAPGCHLKLLQQFLGAGMHKILARIPSAVFAPSPAGAPRYTVLDRSACLGVKFLEYSLAGLVCGFVGQGIANGLMQVK